MRSTFCQPYDEEFARRCILNCFPEFGWKLLLNKQDPPDIIDEEALIGIEVVRAEDGKDAEFFNTYAQYHGKPKSDVPETLTNKFEKNGAKFFCNPDGIVFGAGCFGIEMFKNIQRCITKKTENLNKPSYNKFGVDALFIYNSGRFCFENDLQMIARGDCFPDHQQRKFQLIFIYSDHEVYLCNVINNTVMTRRLQDDDIYRLQKESLYEIDRNNEFQERRDFLYRRKK